MDHCFLHLRACLQKNLMFLNDPEEGHRFRESKIADMSAIDAVHKPPNAMLRG
jgi:hypothetical protein